MKRLILSGLILFILVLAQAASALTVRETRWGYDGQVVPERFTVLSVLIENRSGEAFDDTISLSKNRGMGDQIGATYAQPCYISPFSSRWDQFYPYIDEEFDRWKLQLGHEFGNSQNIEQPKVGPPACVLLYDPETVVAVSSSFKMFPDNLFPSTVAAADGVATLIMDYAPRWEAAKRDAFLQWLRQGGTVHLLLGADGKFPIFPSGLDALNAPTNHIVIGAGLVVRHQLTRSEMRGQTLIKDGFYQPQLQTSNSSTLGSVSQSFFQALIPLSGSHQSWGFIHLFALGYLLVIGPGHFYLAKRLPDYRLRIFLLLAGVACFGALFTYIGRRGQTGTSIVHSLSYAHSLHDGTYNVTQWVNIFATHGDYYTITHASAHNLYATALDYEGVKGAIQSGKDGKFMVDIPLYSHRNFLHQARLAGEDIDATVLQWPDANDLQHAVLAVGPHFPKDAIEIWVLWQAQLFRMNLVDGQLIVNKAVGSQDRDQFLTAQELQQMNEFIANQSAADKEPTAAQYCRAMMRPLIAWGLGGTSAYRQSIQWPAPPKNHASLFVFAPSPESFRVSGDKFGQEIGYVLYHSDLVIPATERNP